MSTDEGVSEGVIFKDMARVRPKAGWPTSLGDASVALNLSLPQTMGDERAWKARRSGVLQPRGD